MEYSCIYCNYTTKRTDCFNRHNLTKLHNKRQILYLKDKTNAAEKNQITEEKINTLITNALNKSKIAEIAKDTNNQVKQALKTSTSLIKYLMLNHSNAPALEQISMQKSKEILYKDYNVNETDNKYTLHAKLLLDYKQTTFIDKIKTSILNNIRKEQPEQSIYNTDFSRLNYIIKTNLYNWIEDKSGIHFDKLVIKPILDTIKDLMTEYKQHLDKKCERVHNKIEELEKLEYNMCNSNVKSDDLDMAKLDDTPENKLELDNDTLLLYYTCLYNNTCEDIISIKNMISDLKLNKFNKSILRQVGPSLRILIKNKDLELLEETDSDNDSDNDSEILEEEIELEISELKKRLIKLENRKTKIKKTNKDININKD